MDKASALCLEFFWQTRHLTSSDSKSLWPVLPPCVKRAVNQAVVRQAEHGIPSPSVAFRKAPTTAAPVTGWARSRRLKPRFLMVGWSLADRVVQRAAARLGLAEWLVSLERAIRRIE